MIRRRQLFVTVGTTQFDSLIKEVTSIDALKAVGKLGFTDVSLQIGNGPYEPTEESRHQSENLPSISYFRLKDSITEDIAKADMVICHAGAGSILGSLSAGKHVLVVINDELMGNHQTELAEKLTEDCNLHCCSVSNLVKTLTNLTWDNILPFPPGQPEKFARALDELMGFAA